MSALAVTGPAGSVGSAIAVTPVRTAADASPGRAAEFIRAASAGWTEDLSQATPPGVAQRPPQSIGRIREELAWTPDLSLEEGLRRTLHGR